MDNLILKKYIFIKYNIVVMSVNCQLDQTKNPLNIRLLGMPVNDSIFEVIFITYLYLLYGERRRVCAMACV